jgi:hypothetical protein
VNDRIGVRPARGLLRVDRYADVADSRQRPTLHQDRMPQVYAKSDALLMRRALPRAFHWIAWRSGHSLREARRIRKPRILMYHAVGENDTPADLFAWQLEFLRE